MQILIVIVNVVKRKRGGSVRWGTAL